MKAHSRLFLLLFTCTVVMLGNHSLARGASNIPIIPTNGKSITLVINGEAKNYYLLKKNGHLTVELDGPGKLIVLNRLSLMNKRTASEQYSIKVMEGKNTLKIHTTQTDRSDASYKNSSLVPGKSRKFSLEVPEGSHTYNFFLENTNADEAAFKFMFAHRKGSGTLISLEPLSYDKIVTTIVQEKLITYYVASNERGVQLRTVGPTRLQISTRLNYDSTMKGDQRYSISIHEGAKQILLKPLATTKSVGVFYQEWKNVVPGKVNEFNIDVPKGEHIYKFDLEQTLAHSVSLKFSIPKNDLSNEK